MRWNPLFSVYQWWNIQQTTKALILYFQQWNLDVWRTCVYWHKSSQKRSYGKSNLSKGTVHQLEDQCYYHTNEDCKNENKLFEEYNMFLKQAINESTCFQYVS